MKQSLVRVRRGTRARTQPWGVAFSTTGVCVILGTTVDWLCRCFVQYLILWDVVHVDGLLVRWLLWCVRCHHLFVSGLGRRVNDWLWLQWHWSGSCSRYGRTYRVLQLGSRHRVLVVHQGALLRRVMMRRRWESVTKRRKGNPQLHVSWNRRPRTTVVVVVVMMVVVVVQGSLPW